MAGNPNGTKTVPVVSDYVATDDDLLRMRRIEPHTGREAWIVVEAGNETGLPGLSVHPVVAWAWGDASETPPVVPFGPLALVFGRWMAMTNRAPALQHLYGSAMDAEKAVIDWLASD